MMERRIKVFAMPALVLLLMLAFTAASAQVPERPYPPRLVNDLAGVFTSSQNASLERRLVAFDDTTSNQIAVVTVADLGGEDISMLAYEIGEKWGVGREKSNNGIVMLIKPKTASSGGQVFISIGYGLEGAIPDAITKRIIENEMIPHLKNGNDYYSAVNAALDVLMPLACGEISERDYDGDDDAALAALVFFLMFVAFIVFLLASNGGSTNIGSGTKGHQLDIWDLIFLNQMFGSGSGSGRSSSGWGGSSGGSFGGGGFSGGGFGGFGGGHFGGGGAGGSW